MGQQADSDLWPFKLFVDLITEANYVFPVLLAVGRVGGFILGQNKEDGCYKEQGGSSLVA